MSWISHTWLEFYSKRKRIQRNCFIHKRQINIKSVTMDLFSCIWFSKWFSIFFAVPCNSVLVLNWVWMFVYVRTGAKGKSIDEQAHWQTKRHYYGLILLNECEAKICRIQWKTTTKVYLQCDIINNYVHRTCICYLARSVTSKLQKPHISHWNVNFFLFFTKCMKICFHAEMNCFVFVEGRPLEFVVF